MLSDSPLNVKGEWGVGTEILPNFQAHLRKEWSYLQSTVWNQVNGCLNFKGGSKLLKSPGLEIIITYEFQYHVKVKVRKVRVGLVERIGWAQRLITNGTFDQSRSVSQWETRWSNSGAGLSVPGHFFFSIRIFLWEKHSLGVSITFPTILISLQFVLAVMTLTLSCNNFRSKIIF